jgi:hypothetical protein
VGEALFSMFLNEDGALSSCPSSNNAGVLTSTARSKRVEYELKKKKKNAQMETDVLLR